MTPISASTSDRRQRGFTLLEILLVSALLALFASIALPLVNRQGNPRDFDWQAERLRDTIQRLNENSLFRGELLALRLSDEGYLPLRYEPELAGFVLAEDSRGALDEFELPEGIVLEWEVEEIDEEDPDAVDLADVAEARLLRNDDMDVDLGLDEDDEDEAGALDVELERDEDATAPTLDAATEDDVLDLEDNPPQLFFFPSGEVTPVTMILVDTESGEERRLEVNAMGRVELEDDDDEG